MVTDWGLKAWAFLRRAVAAAMGCEKVLEGRYWLGPTLQAKSGEISS
jgi:hypothetical protein